MKVNSIQENKNKGVLSGYPKIAPSRILVLDISDEFLSSQDTGDLEKGDHHHRMNMMTLLRRWAAK